MIDRQPVEFFSDGIRHAAELFVPDRGAERAPAVVVCHGYGGTMSFIVADIASRLAQSGYVALIFDYRGFGKSGGERHRLIPREQVRDIVDAVTFVASRPEVDANRVGLFGTSFGAANVVYAAAEDTRVKATVSSIGFSDGEDWLRSLRPNWAWMQFLDRLAADRVQRVLTGRSEIVHPDEIMVRDPESLEYNRMLLETFPDRAFRLPLESAERIIAHKPISVVADIAPRALLVIRAGRDALMPQTHGPQLFAAAGEPKYFALIPDAEHHAVYAGPPFELVMQHAHDFFRRHL